MSSTSTIACGRVSHERRAGRHQGAWHPAGGQAPLLPGRWRHGGRRPSRYSGFVGLMRYLLPAVAACLLGLVVGWPLVSDGGEGIRIPLATDAGIDGRSPC